MGILVYFLISLKLSILFLFCVFKISKSNLTLYFSKASMFDRAPLIHPNSSLIIKMLNDPIIFIRSIFKPSRARGEKAPPAPSTNTGAFFDITLSLIKNKPLPNSELKWERLPYTKKQLDNLCILSKKMDQSEIERRKKATTYGEYSPKFIDK